MDHLFKAGTVGTQQRLIAANANVNGKIIPMKTPIPQLEPWKLWPKSGWCGDFAVTKRHELLLSGWPSSALLLAQVTTAMGEEHAVLVARMSDSDYVLDNLVGELRSPDRTGFKWVKIQDEKDPHRWLTPVLTSAPVPQSGTVSDKAIEAGAIAYFADNNRKTVAVAQKDWARYSDAQKAPYRKVARVILSAAGGVDGN